MVSRTFHLGLLLLTGLQLSSVCQAQATNLLRNPDASAQSASWRAYGEATVEPTTGNNLCFVVRNGGYFLQDVELPKEAAGQYAVLIGRGSSERINADGAITGLPYLYGYMMEKGRPDRKEILAYLQGQEMRSRSVIKGEWVQLSGVFEVPEGTNTIRFFLNQAERKGVPHNGSAARFDDLGLYLFATKEEAENFVAVTYR
jgi:hypothetical protein